MKNKLYDSKSICWSGVQANGTGCWMDGAFFAIFPFALFPRNEGKCNALDSNEVDQKAYLSGDESCLLPLASCRAHIKHRRVENENDKFAQWIVKMLAIR